jgi:hypothetical protein
VGTSTRTFAALGSIVLAVAVLAGWGLKSPFGHSNKNPQAQTAYPTALPHGMQMPSRMTLPPGMAMPTGMGMPPNMAISPALLERVDQVAMYKLMAERHLSARAAVYLMKSKIQLIGKTKTPLHFLMSFPDGGTIDETITILPNQPYTPSGADLERAARARSRVYNPRLKFKKNGPDSLQATLEYNVPYSALPKEVLERIGAPAQGAPPSTAGFFNLVPPAWGQARVIAEPTAGLFFNMLAEHWKEIDKLTGKEVETPLSLAADAPLALLDLFISMKELGGQMSQIGDLQDCTKNPTNPLTEKASHDPNYEHDVLDPLSDSKFDVGLSFFPKVGNLAAGYLTHSLPFGSGFLLSPFLSMNDDAIKSINEGHIEDAEKLVVKCDKPIELTPGAFRPMKGTFEYTYNLVNDKMCLQQQAQGGCSFHTATRQAQGKFSLNPDNFGLLVGDGAGTIQEQADMHVDKTKASSRSTKSGAAVAEFKCGGDPQSGVIQMTIHGEALKFDEEGQGPGGESYSPIHLNSSSFSTSCEFRNVDFTKGGATLPIPKTTAMERARLSWSGEGWKNLQFGYGNL